MGLKEDRNIAVFLRQAPVLLDNALHYIMDS